MRKRILIFALLLCLTATMLCSIPSAAAMYGVQLTKLCSCSYDFYGDYFYGISNNEKMSSASIQLDHYCQTATAYVSLTSWIYSESNYNNYTTRTSNASGTYDADEDHCEAYVDHRYGINSLYNIRGTESNHRATTTCNGTVYTYRYFESEGDVPLSVTPPVVVR